MMKGLVKVVITLSLLVIFLIACFSLITIGYFGAWLHTYRVFTEKRPVAEVTISELKKDENGTYSEVTFKPYLDRSALEKLVNQNDKSNSLVGDPVSYKLYGDTVYIGGPIVKFKDELILFNFKTIFKIGKIYSRYDLDNELEINRNDVSKQNSSYDINGGYSDWKSIFDNINRKDLIGSFYRLFIDTTQISSPGVFVGNTSENYILYMTNTGFLWDIKE